MTSLLSNQIVAFVQSFLDLFGLRTAARARIGSGRTRPYAECRALAGNAGRRARLKGVRSPWKEISGQASFRSLFCRVRELV